MKAEDHDSVSTMMLSLQSAERPFILIGGGFWSGGNADYTDLVNKIGFPCGVTWSGAKFSNKLINYVGVVGQFGRPVANNLFHSADFVLSLGSRLSSTVTGHNVSLLKNAFLLQADCDELELERQKIRLESTAYSGSLRSLLESVHSGVRPVHQTRRKDWKNWLKSGLSRYESEQFELQNRFDNQPQAEMIRSHEALARFFRSTRPDSDVLVIDGGGTALYSAFQGIPLSRFGAVISTPSISSMGTAPAQMFAASLQFPNRLVSGIIGDGSFFTALNQLPMLADLKNVLLVVISNRGYLAIRHTQQKYLGNRLEGTFYEDESLPSIQPVAESLGFRYLFGDRDLLARGLEAFKENSSDFSGPCILEIHTDPDQPPYWSTKLVASLPNESPAALPLLEMAYCQN